MTAKGASTGEMTHIQSLIHAAGLLSSSETDIYGSEIITIGTDRLAIGYDTTDGDWINWTLYAFDGDEWETSSSDGCPDRYPAPAVAALAAFAAGEAA